MRPPKMRAAGKFDKKAETGYQEQADLGIHKLQVFLDRGIFLSISG